MRVLQTSRVFTARFGSMALGAALGLLLLFLFPAKLAVLLSWALFAVALVLSSGGVEREPEEARLQSKETSVVLEMSTDREIWAIDVVGSCILEQGKDRGDIVLAAQGESPIILSHLTAEECQRIQSSLSLEPSNGGQVLWTGPSRYSGLAIGVLLGVVARSLSVSWINYQNGQSLLMPIVSAILATSIASVMISFRRGSSLQVGEKGILLGAVSWVDSASSADRGKEQKVFLRWDEIAYVSKRGETLMIRSTDGRERTVSLRVSAEVAEFIHKQLQQGMALAKASARRDALGMLEALRRRPDESEKEWVSRIDDIRVADHRFRDSASPTTEELNRCVLDSALDGSIRAAAARVLLRSEPSQRVRIRQSLNEIPDEEERLALESIWEHFEPLEPKEDEE